MTSEESQEHKAKGSIATNCGHKNVVGNVDIVEYHIDASYTFEERLCLFLYGGNLIVRKPFDSKTVVVRTKLFLNNSYS